jgi:PAT family acetyl-CoA transporter-like MFS transporter 1
VALDGWAITLLSKENVSWQATCNNVGYTSGFLIGEIMFVILDSRWFCNVYVRPLFGLPIQDHGIVSLECND